MHAAAERLLHQRIEPAGRLVEKQQPGSAHERRDEDQLLAVAFGISADLLRRVEVELLDEFFLIRLVDASLNTTEQVEGLGAGKRGPQVGLPGDIGELAMGLHGLALTVDPEDLGAPSRRVDQPEQEPDGRRLSCPVRSEVADDLAFVDLEVEVAQRVDASVALAEARCPDGCSSHRGILSQNPAPTSKKGSIRVMLRPWRDT